MTIDSQKLNVRTAIKGEIGEDIYLPLTGYLEEDKRYVIKRQIERRKLSSEDTILTKIIIQSVDDAKLICQNWNDIKCEDCDVFNMCELILEN